MDTVPFSTYKHLIFESWHTVQLCFSSLQQINLITLLGDRVIIWKPRKHLLAELWLRCTSHRTPELCDRLQEERFRHAISLEWSAGKKISFFGETILFLFLGHRELCAVSFSSPGTSSPNSEWGCTTCIYREAVYFTWFWCSTSINIFVDPKLYYL